jgi:predicted glycosyltransferase
MKVLLYCHNVLGFGHIVRSLRIAEELLARDVECRLITGCRFLDRLHVPDGVEVVSIPALRAEADGTMVSVDGGFLGTAIRKRSRMIAEQLRSWQPDAILVDHNPFGLMGELLESLQAAKSLPTRFIWGIRDIGSANVFKMSRDVSAYHGAIAYTDRAWLDTFDAYREITLPLRTESVGFVTTPITSSPAADGRPIIAVLSGGGDSADRLMELMLNAGDYRMRFVAGPFADLGALSSPGLRPPSPRDAGRGNSGEADEGQSEIWPEGSVEDAIAGASLVVCRAGYNTAYTVVQSDLPIVFVPLRANEEQSTRANRLATLPNIECIEEDAGALRESIDRGLSNGRHERQLPFSTNGARRAAEWIIDETSAAHG